MKTETNLIKYEKRIIGSTNSLTSLKKMLAQVGEEYTLKTFFVLYKIMRIKKYNQVKQVAEEVKGYLSYDQVNYYLGLRFCSKETWNLIFNKSKVTPQLMCRTFYRSRSLKNEQLQQQFTKQIQKGKITYRDIMYSPSELLINKLEKKEMSESSKLCLQTVHNLRTTLSHLDNHKYKISKDDMEKIKRSAKSLINKVQEKNERWVLLSARTSKLLTKLNKKQHEPEDELIYRGLMKLKGGDKK